MKMFKLDFIQIISVITVLAADVDCRRYDIEADAIKLYGEDLRTVIHKFRRSPEYLQILQDKKSDLEYSLNDILFYNFNHFLNAMDDRVKETAGVNKNEEEKEDATKPDGSEKLNRYFKTHLRTDTKIAMSPVQILDSYPKLQSVLTLQEKHSFADIGYEYYGRAIHAVIKYMEPDENPAVVKSTKHPYGGDNLHGKTTTTTTEHVHVHEVTSKETSPHLQEESTATPDSFRFRYKPSLHAKTVN